MSKRKQKKYNASVKKIERVFDAMKKLGIAVNGTDKNDAFSTIDQYERYVKSYFDKFSKETGEVDILKMDHNHFMKYVTEEIENWKKGDLASAHRVKAARAALESFRYGTIRTNVFQKELKCIDKKKVKETLDYNHMRRMSAATSTISLDRNDGETILKYIKGFKDEHGKVKGSRSQYRELAYHCFKISMLTGGRISDVVDKLTVKDIKWDEKKIEFRNSKGGLTAQVAIDNETLNYLKDLTKDKSSNEPLIRIRKSDGKYMNKKDSIRTINAITEKAGKDSGLNNQNVEITYKCRDEKGKSVEKTTTVKQKVSHHTARKIFVTDRFQKYEAMEDKQINKILDNRLENPEIQRKYNKAVQRINESRSSGGRDMYKYEKAIFLASLDSRHFRNDVITMWYLDKKMMQKHRKNARK